MSWNRCPHCEGWGTLQPGGADYGRGVGFLVCRVCFHIVEVEHKRKAS